MGLNKPKNPPVEVAIHTILYVRRVYPPDLFIRRKKYDTPVFQSRHPALNKYISGAVKAIGEELALVSVSRVWVIFPGVFELRLAGTRRQGDRRDKEQGG